MPHDAARARFFHTVARIGREPAEGLSDELQACARELSELGCGAWSAICRFRRAELLFDAGDLSTAASEALAAARVLDSLGLKERAGSRGRPSRLPSR